MGGLNDEALGTNRLSRSMSDMAASYRSRHRACGSLARKLIEVYNAVGDVISNFEVAFLEQKGGAVVPDDDVFC